MNFKFYITSKITHLIHLVALLAILTSCQTEDAPPTVTPPPSFPSPLPTITLSSTSVATIIPSPTSVATTIPSPTENQLPTEPITLPNTPTAPPLPTATLERFPNEFGLIVPAGMKVQLFRDNLNSPTALVFGEQGELYVGVNNGLYPTKPVGEIYRLRDQDGDGWAEELTVFAQELDRPVGLAFRQGALYLSQRGSVVRMQDTDENGQADALERLIWELPAYGLHHNGGITFGPDGLLYFALGSSTNNGPEENPLNATILRAHPDGSNLQIFASGLRNVYDLTFDAHGTLFATDNGCDPPECEDAPEELNQIVEGATYGYPDYVGSPPAESGTLGPLLTFPTHTSANGLLVYEGSMFPEWQGDIMIALFGSYLPGFTEVGRQLVRVALTPQASYVPFVRGLNRPLDLTVAPDGSIFVADFGAGRIYRLYR